MLRALQAVKRPVEAHFYEEGGHGFGLGAPGMPVHGWIKLFANWIEQQEAKAARNEGVGNRPAGFPEVHGRGGDRRHCVAGRCGLCGGRNRSAARRAAYVDRAAPGGAAGARHLRPDKAASARKA